MIPLHIITREEFSADESRQLKDILENFPVFIHIRKPRYPLKEYISFLNTIPEELRTNVFIHEFHEECASLGPGGLHIPVRSRSLYFQKLKNLFFIPEKKFNLSFSLHEVDKNFIPDVITDFVFISPVWNSISKPGYPGKKISPSAFNIPSSVQRIALGGIVPENIKQTLELGYDGIAVCGWIWNSGQPVRQVEEIWNQLQTISLPVASNESLGL